MVFIKREIAKHQFLIGGVICGTLAPYMYFIHGYSTAVVGLWLLALVLCARYFYRPGLRAFFTRADTIAIILLLLIATPVYLWKIYTIPFQINTDEITIMHFMKKFTSVSSPDIFALSEYFYFPSFIFIVMGWLGKAIGGITLLHMRLLHAISGIAIVVASYLLFRALRVSPLCAAGGAVLVGSNHALLAISRMAMRDNVALLVMVVALFFLVRGFERSSGYETYLGGAVMGLTFYNYFPGRIGILLWGVFLLGVMMFFRKEKPASQIVRLGFISGLGFLLVVGPIAAATLKTSGYGAAYARQQLMIFPEGQELQRTWVNAQNIYEGMYINARQGLFAFNAPYHDHGYIYPNYSHGFVDPVSGVLIWVGFLFFLFKLQKTKEDFLVVSGFFVLWLAFAFLTTKNPNYTRYLLILPFVVGLILEALVPLSNFIERRLPQFGGIAFLCCIAYISILNMAIFGDFVQKGFLSGNDVGGTARYIEERSNSPTYSFYLAADAANPYYSWGNESQWKTWMGFFTRDSQKATVLPSQTIGQQIYTVPFTIFMNQALYQQSGHTLKELYPNAELHNIKPDGSLVALEVR